MVLLFSRVSTHPHDDKLLINFYGKSVFVVQRNTSLVYPHNYSDITITLLYFYYINNLSTTISTTDDIQYLVIIEGMEGEEVIRPKLPHYF
jgi:hypothetical protein